MAIVSDVSSMLNIERIGAGWQPKARRILVGRDVGAFTATTFTGKAMSNTVIANGDDVSLKSKGLFNMARSAAQKGFGVKNFRAISDRDLEEGSVHGGGLVRKSGDYQVKSWGNALEIEKGDYSATIQDGVLTIYKANGEDGQSPALIMKKAITEDARLVWNENGEPELLTGNAARTNGVLRAQGKNEVIISMSGSDVRAGEGTVVLNLSGRTGAYSGGNDVTYLGTYQGGNFTDIEGKVTFGGYFNNASFSKISGVSEFSGVFDAASIALEKGHSTFSGYFSASEIAGGATNTMSGLFLNACTVRGGEGDDAFNGRFIGCDIEGGEGDNSFGYGGLHLMRRLNGLQMINEQSHLREYKGIEADFINSTVTAASGNDRVNGVVFGGSFDLGQGDDSTDGIFSGTVINGGGGSDALRAAYAVDSTFNTGHGDDSVTLKTAISNAVITGDGTNAITMGLNHVASSATTWQTRDEYFSGARPRETGELARNTIDASRGENAITVNNGETSRRVIVHDLHAMDDSQAGEAGTINETDAAAVTAAPGEGLPAAASAAMSAAISKYREVLGTEAQNKGEAAVSIDYGDGFGESFMGVERADARANPQETGMIRSVRRYNSDGSISWKRWQRVGD